jgi:signal peptidase complex subunit 1
MFHYSHTRPNANPLQILAFFVGFMAQDIRLTLYVGLAGTLLTFLVAVPPWPFYNKNPEPWLSPLTKSNMSIDVDGQKVG